MKALCIDCGADLDVALACRGRHEDQARKLSHIQVRAGLAGSMLPVILVTMGLLFATWGFMGQPMSFFTVLFGIGLVVLAVVFAIRSKMS
jgi:predicted membrane channel-forming protein YqfA (hemolysin III family)